MHERGLDQLELLRNVDIFRTLDDAQLRQMRALLKQQRFRAGQSIFLQGDPGNCLYIILEGYVRIYLLSADGREVTFRVYGNGAAFGEFAVLDGKPRSACAVALTNSSALVIYREDFLALIERNAAVLQRVVAALTERIRHTTLFAQSLAFLSASGRVAAALVALADQASLAPEPVQLKITQRELASYAGATREWTNHALRDFADEGLVQVTRGTVTVLERERLRLWADV
jgi:CRP/FNR family transcriptional regulator, cyclic AMP receptor protein